MVLGLSFFLTLVFQTLTLPSQTTAYLTYPLSTLLNLLADQPTSPFAITHHRFTCFLCQSLPSTTQDKFVLRFQKIKEFFLKFEVKFFRFVM